MEGNEDSSKLKAAVVKLDWSFWGLLLLIIISTKLLGLVGGLAAWGMWSLVAFLIKKYRA
jgi:hypothetical protein